MSVNLYNAATDTLTKVAANKIEVNDELVIQDETELTYYSLKISNGKLYIEETIPTELQDLKLTDITTGKKYILKLNNKELYAEEVTE